MTSFSNDKIIPCSCISIKKTMNLKRFFQLIVVSVLLVFGSSCSKVLRIYHVDSVNTKKDNDRFVYENDSVKVIYDFWYEDGVMLFAVQNKLDKALTIDWKKSHFSLNGLVFPYWRDVDRVRTSGKANTWGTGYGRSFWGFTSFSSSSVVSRDADKSLISPDSWIERGDYSILKTYIGQVEGKLESLKNQQAPSDEIKRVREEFYSSPLLTQLTDSANFSKEDSPLSFRNYLTFKLDGDENENTVDNSFSVSKVSSTVMEPKKVKKTAFKQKSGASFFRIEKNRHIIYPKNNIYFGAGGFPSINSNGAGNLPSFSIAELGYSRLVKNRLELGISYVFAAQGVKAKFIGQNKTSSAAPLGHKVSLRVMGYVPNKRAVRLSLGVNIYTGFYNKVTTPARAATTGNYGQQAYVGHNIKSIVTVGGLFEIGLNLGSRGFNVNPFIAAGVQNLSGSIEALDGVGKSRMDFTHGVIGGGIRWRIQFR